MTAYTLACFTHGSLYPLHASCAPLLVADYIPCSSMPIADCNFCIPFAHGTFCIPLACLSSMNDSASSTSLACPWEPLSVGDYTLAWCLLITTHFRELACPCNAKSYTSIIFYNESFSPSFPLCRLSDPTQCLFVSLIAFTHICYNTEERNEAHVTLSLSQTYKLYMYIHVIQQ